VKKVNKFGIVFVKDWNFITNHGLVLLYISQKPEATTREIADAVKITERTVHRILVDLEEDGYITRTRTGRANIYGINHELALKNDLTRKSAVKDLLGLIGD
jgi:DeoR/GlpR family transcriptional regulator of sugar metabolism